MEEDIKKVTNIKIDAEEMTSFGLHFGHKVSKLHPRMKSFISGVKNNVQIIDLEKTVKEFEKALQYISKVISDKKVMVFVGTKIQMKEMLKATAIECNLPYVCERWLGGTFTNFETIQKRVEYYKDLERKKATGELEKYTKKERMKLDKEIEGLRIKFDGIRSMSKLPEAIFILDIKKDETCVREAKKKGIKIIGVCDTNVDPTMVDYAIPANDDAISSIKYILEKTKEVILNSK